DRGARALASDVHRHRRAMRLAPAATAGGRERAGEPGPVQRLDLEGHRPQVAVVRAQEEAMQPPRTVVISRDHSLPGRGAGRRRRLPGENRRNEERRQADNPGARPAQLSHSPNSSVALPARAMIITPNRARPSRKNSTRMKPLALRANRVLSSAVTRSM